MQPFEYYIIIFQECGGFLLVGIEKLLRSLFETRAKNNKKNPEPNYFYFKVGWVAHSPAALNDILESLYI